MTFDSDALDRRAEFKVGNCSPAAGQLLQVADQD